MFENEFDLWMNTLVKKDWDKVSRTAQSVKEHIAKHMEEKLTGLGINRFQITQAVNEAGINGFNSANWTEEDFQRFIVQLRKVSKPLIVAANKADRDGADKNVERIREAGYLVVPTCAEAELALRRAAEAGLLEYTPGDKDFTIKNPEKLTKGQINALEKIREKVFQKYGGTGLQEVLNTAFFSLLDMINVYPVEDAEKLTNHQGHVLPDCFLVPKGTTAKQFAGVIHTDLAESFIHAVDARTKRRLGDTYILQDNDIIQIVSAKSRR
jgi:ribosome-binding ATPase YchF (GTP1/OBG family)